MSLNLKSDIIATEYDGAYFRRASGIFTDRDGLNDKNCRTPDTEMWTDICSYFLGICGISKPKEAGPKITLYAIWKDRCTYFE